MIKDGTIIPPKPKSQPSPMKLALAQGKSIQQHFRIAELEEQLIYHRRWHRLWRGLAMGVWFAYIIRYLL